MPTGIYLRFDTVTLQIGHRGNVAHLAVDEAWDLWRTVTALLTAAEGTENDVCPAWCREHGKHDPTEEFGSGCLSGDASEEHRGAVALTREPIRVGRYGGEGNGVARIEPSILEVYLSRDVCPEGSPRDGAACREG